MDINVHSCHQLGDDKKYQKQFFGYDKLKSYSENINDEPNDPSFELDKNDGYLNLNEIDFELDKNDFQLSKNKGGKQKYKYTKKRRFYKK
jgi:hypothetical protein